MLIIPLLSSSESLRKVDLPLPIRISVSAVTVPHQPGLASQQRLVKSHAVAGLRIETWRNRPPPAEHSKVETFAILARCLGHRHLHNLPPTGHEILTEEKSGWFESLILL